MSDPLKKYNLNDIVQEINRRGISEEAVEEVKRINAGIQPPHEIIPDFEDPVAEYIRKHATPEATISPTKKYLIQELNRLAHEEELFKLKLDKAQKANDKHRRNVNRLDKHSSSGPTLEQQEKWAQQIYDGQVGAAISTLNGKTTDPPVVKVTVRKKEVQPCTPDWEFDDKVYSCWIAGKKVDYSWSCACGDSSTTYDTKMSSEERKAEAWNSFMIHKLAHGVDDAQHFNEVWDECFPAPEKKSTWGSNWGSGIDRRTGIILNVLNIIMILAFIAQLINILVFR